MFTRRNFLRLGLGALTGAAIDKVVPLHRVFSFPTNIVIPKAIVTPDEFGTLSHLSSAHCVALQLEKVREMIPTLYMSQDIFWIGLDRKPLFMDVHPKQLELWEDLGLIPRMDYDDDYEEDYDE